MRAAFILSLLATPAWASAPTISAVVPAQLTTAGGTITVKGTDFAADASVKVGGYPCADLNVVSTTQLTCTAPANIARKSDVAILNADGGTATAAAALEYTGVPGLALLQQRVFQRFGVNAQGITVVFKCTGCHGGTKPDGNLDLKDYAQISKRVTPKDPNGSLLYQEVRDAKMPPKERQPELKPEEKQALFDWISAGALNN
jgi:hypothetical protein